MLSVERVWACGGSIWLAASFSRLMRLLGEMSGIEASDDKLGAKAIAHGKSLKPQGCFGCFFMRALEKGPLALEQLAREITVDESSSKRVVAFLGQEFSQPRVVLELASTKRVFVIVEWVHQTPELRAAVDRKPSVLTS